MKDTLIFEKIYSLNDENFIVQFYKTIKIHVLSKRNYIEILLFNCQTYQLKSFYLNHIQSNDFINAFKTDIVKALNLVENLRK